MQDTSLLQQRLLRLLGRLLPQRLARHLDDSAHSPVAATLRELAQRFGQDKLGVTASSLTFTSVLALVPFFAVALSIFTAFPSFGRLRLALENWLAGNLIPASIASTVLENLSTFANKASQLGITSMAVLLFTTLSLMLTIDHTLNAIWRVRRQRPLGQRVLVYWAALTLGPLLMGGSLAITSYVATQSSAWLAAQAGVVQQAGQGLLLLLRALQLLLPIAGITLLYHFVPHTTVRWRHALAGGLFAALGLALLRWGMGVYLVKMPSYSLIYGAFATVPVLLLWVYLSWLIVLFGAVIAAYLPALAGGLSRRRGGGPGWDFQLAAEALQALAAVRHQPRRGLSQTELAQALRVDALQLTPALEALQALDWTGQLMPQASGSEPRHVLLADPENTPLAPLIERLLLAPGPALPGLWQTPGGWADASLQAALQTRPAGAQANTGAQDMAAAGNQAGAQAATQAPAPGAVRATGQPG